MNKSPVKTDTYVKTVYNNALILQRVIEYENDVRIGKDFNSGYYPTIGIGLGAILLKQKSVGILLEATIEKNLRFGGIKNSTWYSIKMGIVL